MLTLGGFPGCSLLQSPLSLLLPHFSLPYTGSVPQAHLLFLSQTQLPQNGR